MILLLLIAMAFVNVLCIQLEKLINEEKVLVKPRPKNELRIDKNFILFNETQKFFQALPWRLAGCETVRKLIYGSRFCISGIRRWGYCCKVWHTSRASQNTHTGPSALLLINPFELLRESEDRFHTETLTSCGQTRAIVVDHLVFFIS